MLVTTNLHFRAREKSILKNINLTIAANTVTAILGPNGAGKSSLLKCLTGSITPSEGSIILDNTPLADYPLNKLAQKRAVLSQSTPISFPFSALEIVMMGRNPFHDAEPHIIALESLELVDALHLKDRIFPTLSGGEQQRVQLARVLTQIHGQKNSYLFLDEPTSALDLKHQHHILKLAKNLTKQKVTVIIILHDINLAMSYAENIVLLKNGEIHAAGKTQHTLTANNIQEVFEIEVTPIENIENNHTFFMTAA